MVFSRFKQNVRYFLLLIEIILDVSENDVSIALTNDQTNETKKYVACLVVGEETENKSKYGAGIEQKYQKNMCRSNSSVTKISNWRKSNAEENLYSESSRV